MQVSLVLPSLQDSLGPGYTYLIFSAIAVVALGVIYTVVPETKVRHALMHLFCVVPA